MYFVVAGGQLPWLKEETHWIQQEDERKAALHARLGLPTPPTPGAYLHSVISEADSIRPTDLREAAERTTRARGRGVRF